MFSITSQFGCCYGCYKADVSHSQVGRRPGRLFSCGPGPSCLPLGRVRWGPPGSITGRAELRLSLSCRVRPLDFVHGPDRADKLGSVKSSQLYCEQHWGGWTTIVVNKYRAKNKFRKQKYYQQMQNEGQGTLRVGSEPGLGRAQTWMSRNYQHPHQKNQAYGAATLKLYEALMTQPGPENPGLFLLWSCPQLATDPDRRPRI